MFRKIKGLFRGFFFVTLYATVVGIVASSAQQETGIEKLEVGLSIISHRPLLKVDGESKRPRAIDRSRQEFGDLILGGENDVISVGSGDDITVRWRLTNTGLKPTYYLAERYNCRPAGFALHRKLKAKEWNATSPARGRASAMTGEGFKWIELMPGRFVDFEFSDLSTREGEHAISLFVSSEPTHLNRRELISGAYDPSTWLNQ